jgi:hypothetical protein
VSPRPFPFNDGSLRHRLSRHRANSPDPMFPAASVPTLSSGCVMKQFPASSASSAVNAVALHPRRRWTGRRYVFQIRPRYPTLDAFHLFQDDLDSSWVPSLTRCGSDAPRRDGSERHPRRPLGLGARALSLLGSRLVSWSDVYLMIACPTVQHGLTFVRRRMFTTAGRTASSP